MTGNSTDKGCRWLHRIHDHFFPHERNAYQPHIFSPVSLGVFVLGLLVLQGAYFAQTKLIFERTDFLASVLPGALTALTNDDRAANNLPEVVQDPKLVEAAQLAVNDMASRGYFAHVSPDGKSPWYWLNRVGYDYSYSGQNLAVEFTDSKAVEDAWMKSPTHRANITKAQYTRIGIAVANGTYNGKKATFVVQYFATPRVVAVAPASAPVPSAPESAPAPAAEPEAAPAPETEPGVPTTENSAAPAPTEAEVVTTEPVPADSAVLGAESEALSIQVMNAANEPGSFFAKVVTSPSATLIFLLTLFTSAAIVLFAITLAKHVRALYVEAVGGGAAFLAIALLFLLVNIALRPTVTVPAQSPGGSTIETVSFAR
ncbi:MAG: hypothetical protein QOE22_198 [Candidatus Parcubacteria bacterium]|jgi:hypothetical protein|nr:hypothetical protein [Candidatus Parcubacteria bacterium]